MAYDRYDTRMRRESRFEDRNDRSPRSYGRKFDRERTRNLDYDRSDRDFFDRASDEVRSWFGDDRATRRREIDERYDDEPRGRSSGSRTMNRTYETGYGRSRAPRGSYDQLPFADTYGSESGYDRSDRYDYDRAYPQNRFDRGQTQSQYSQGGMFDEDYVNWRSRQIDQLDNDYAEWRSENNRRFDNEFTDWRSDRMTKRDMMRSIPQHADVVDCDGQHVGTIDKVVGDRMILTKNDSDDGHHHSLTCRHLDTVDNGTVKLNLSADKAQDEWRDEDRNRALGEKFSSDEGPHMLDRSFSHTY